MFQVTLDWELANKQKTKVRDPCRIFGSVQNIHRDIWSMPKGPSDLVLSKTSMSIIGPCQMVLDIWSYQKQSCLENVPGFK